MFIAIPIDKSGAIPLDIKVSIAIDIFRAIAIDIFRAIDMRMKGRQKRPPTSGSPGLTPGRELRKELGRELHCAAAAVASATIINGSYTFTTITKF